MFVLQGREICVGSLYCRALGIELDSSIECVVVCRSVRKCDSTNTQPIIVVASYLAGARIHFFLPAIAHHRSKIRVSNIAKYEWNLDFGSWIFLVKIFSNHDLSLVEEDAQKVGVFARRTLLRPCLAVKHWHSC